MADDRRRAWAAIVYPDSEQGDSWLEVLERLRVPAAVSPLHDRDRFTKLDELENPAHVEGTLKKAHYHIVLFFDSVKSTSQVLSLLEPLGINYVVPVESTRAYCRYLCHMDNPEKAQYDAADVVTMNGARYDISRPDPTADEQMVIQKELMALIEDNGLVEYYDLMRICVDTGRDDWLWFASRRTVMLDALLRSKRNAIRDAQRSDKGI